MPIRTHSKPSRSRRHRFIEMKRNFLQAYLETAGEEAFYRNLDLVFPGFGWYEDNNGRWISSYVPELPHHETHYEFVEPSGVIEEDGELIDYADSDNDYRENVEFSVSHAEATPFQYQVYWESEYGEDFEYPADAYTDIDDTTDMSPRLSRSPDDVTWIRECQRLLRKLLIPTPRISVAPVRKSTSQRDEKEWSVKMQIQMRAFGKKGGSLRRIITQHLATKHDSILIVKEGKNNKRSKGWAKVTGKGLSGALNIEWDADQRMLLVRAIAKKDNTPHGLLGQFLAYLIDRHGKNVGSINVQLR